LKWFDKNKNMARPYRLQAENCLYHITSRGNNRAQIFFADSDYKKFLEYLGKAKEKYNFYLCAYVLMANHYHLLLETVSPNLSKIMQYMNTSYTIYHNRKHNKCGHLFQGRYKSIVVDRDTYFLELTRYIHLNPVRANMVAAPENYRWSSYNEFIREHGFGVIDKDQVGKYLDMNGKEYRKFVLAGRQQKGSPFEDTYAGFILGDKGFVKEKLNSLRKQVAGKEISNKGLLKHTIAVEEILRTIARMYGNKPEDLLGSKKRSWEARKAAVYCLKRFTVLTNAQIGKKFGISDSAVSKAAGDFERLIREKPEAEKQMREIISNFKV
jgi:REP element-mobilizing transposase RayT